MATAESLQARIEQQWAVHCYDGYPRKFGFPNQYPIADYQELVDFAVMYNGYRSCYTSVYTLDHQERRLMNKLYIDVDYKHDLSWAWEIKNRLVTTIEQDFGVSPRQYFSGMKGFAIYLDFLPLKIENLYYVGRRLLQKLLIAADITEDDQPFDQFDYGEWMDPGMSGDFSRISRLPYTIHHKSQHLCIPITSAMGLEEILERSSNFCPEYFMSIEPRPMPDEWLQLVNYINTVEYPEWLATKVNQLREHPLGHVSWEEELDLLLLVAAYITDGRHRIVYAMIVPRMVLLGFTDDEIIDYCRSFIELTGEKFDGEWMTYVHAQIRNKRLTGIKPWSWDALIHHYPDLGNIMEMIV